MSPYRRFRVKRQTEDVNQKGAGRMWVVGGLALLAILWVPALAQALNLPQIGQTRGKALDPAVAQAPDAAAKARVEMAYGRLPLHFEANRGQAEAPVQFLARGSGYTMFLTPTEAVLVLRQPREKPSAISYQPSAKPKRTAKTNTTVLHMKLVGANPAPRVSGLEELSGKVNYFLGNDSSKWRTNIPTYYYFVSSASGGNG